MTDNLKAAAAWADANPVRYPHLHRVTLGDPYTPAWNTRRAQDRDAIAAVQAGVSMLSPGYSLGAISDEMAGRTEPWEVRAAREAGACSEFGHEDGEPRHQAIPEGGGMFVALVVVACVAAVVARRARTRVLTQEDKHECTPTARTDRARPRHAGGTFKG